MCSFVQMSRKNRRETRDWLLEEGSGKGRKNKGEGRQWSSDASWSLSFCTTAYENHNYISYTKNKKLN